MTWIDFAVLVAYFAVMIAIGLWSMRRIKGQEDYLMGGRGFGKLLQTFAAFGAGTGAHEPVTVGRTCWTSGLSGVWSAMMWLFVTPVYWITGVWYRRMRHLTLGDWFVERYDSRLLGLAYSIFALVFYMFYLSTMFSAIAKFAVPLLGFESVGGIDVGYVIVPAIAAIVVVYGVLGGLTAAYYTDLIQGVFIILLSVLLIPFGLLALVREFGDPATQGVMDGFRIMHERVADDFFGVFSGPAAGEFPVPYIVSLTLLVLVGIVVQPHFIATGGGSAKGELEARVGLVAGNFLKRLCTVGWALTALIALALLAGSPEIAGDADRVWGVAAREILGPLNLGLVGLMLACLLAAMMSSADTYMIVTAGLFTRNVYAAFIKADASEKECLRVARLSGLAIIVGASVIALTVSDVFGQFKMAVELPILFAAPFWIGMYWRRATRPAVWTTIAFSLVVFFVLPPLVPRLLPQMRAAPGFAQSSHVVTRTTTRPATPSDVARHEAWIKVRDAADGDEAVLKRIGPEPPFAAVGESISVTTQSGGQSLFWQGGLKALGESGLETVEERVEDDTLVLVQRKTGQFEGQGAFNLDFLLYYWLGMDLSSASKSTIETLRLPPRLLMPFLVLILASYLTKRGRDEVLDRYYAKMRTPVHPDPETDRRLLEEAYSLPEGHDSRRLFPKSDWQFAKPTVVDVVGFLVSVAICFAIVGLLAWLAGIGAA
jgi:SSS family solute:Na+ symporter